MVSKPCEYKWSSSSAHVAPALSKEQSVPKHPRLADLNDLGLNWNPEGRVETAKVAI